MNTKPFKMGDPKSAFGSSAIEWLWKKIPLSGSQFGPGLVDKILASEIDFTVELTDAGPFSIGTNSSGTIFLSKKFLVTLWACSYLNITYWLIRTNLGPIGQKIVIDPADHPDLVAAIILFRRAINDQVLEGDSGHWPDLLPQPIANAASGSLEMLAEQIMLRSLGFIILHEIFHCMLGHQADVDPSVHIQQEKDADRETAEAFFDAVPRESGAFMVRCYGMVTALFLTSVGELYRTAETNPNKHQTKHPAGWLRMDHVFQVINLPEGHDGWALAAELKSLYVGIAGGFTGGSFEGPAASMEHYFEAASGNEVLDAGQSPPESSLFTSPPNFHNELLVLLLRKHEQKYAMSCSPSLIEIMLKYHRRVPLDYYELQHKYRDENVGLTVFAGETIEGLSIEKHDPSSGITFIDRLMKEMAAGRIVGVYCRNPDGNGYHGWIVSMILGDTVFMLSKASELGNGEGRQTVMLRRSLAGSNPIVISDLIVAKPVISSKA